MVFKVKISEHSRNEGSHQQPQSQPQVQPQSQPQVQPQVQVQMQAQDRQKPRNPASRPSINVQDQFLNQIRKEKVKVCFELLSGVKLEGFINCFDNFSIILENEGFHLIYKHGISSIRSTEGDAKLKFFDNGAEKR
jgi:host factor-I protein